MTSSVSISLRWPTQNRKRYGMRRTRSHLPIPVWHFMQLDLPPAQTTSSVSGKFQLPTSATPNSYALTLPERERAKWWVLGGEWCRACNPIHSSIRLAKSACKRREGFGFQRGAFYTPLHKRKQIRKCRWWMLVGILLGCGATEWCSNVDGMEKATLCKSKLSRQTNARWREPLLLHKVPGGCAKVINTLTRNVVH